jgi:hypothetical protein
METLHTAGPSGGPDGILKTVEVVMTASYAENSAHHEGLDGPALLEALLTEKNVQPIQSVDDLACDGIFTTDAELDEFLAWVSAERKANLA